MLKINSDCHLKRFPSWLRQSVSLDPEIEATKRLLSDLRLNTVCQDSRCPNLCACFSKKKCTFMILGRYCTRKCRFCSIQSDKNIFAAPDRDELLRIREAVERLKARRVVITSVTRDDLEDGGAGHFADCVDVLKRHDNTLNVEVLVPDFKGDKNSVKKVIFAGPDTFSHNIETVPRLYVDVRPGSDYNRSLNVLRYAKNSAPLMGIKSGIMVGLGETEEEVFRVMKDLRNAGCDIITIGQYLKPGNGCLEVKDFLHPDKFGRFSSWASELGFIKYSCSPLTRSSYLE